MNNRLIRWLVEQQQAIDDRYRTESLPSAKAAAILVTAALALILPRYFGQTQTFERTSWLVEATSHLPYPDLHPHLYWAAFKLVNYGLLLALCIHFVLKQKIRDFGLRFVREPKVWLLYAAMVAAVLPMAYLASTTESFLRTYPKYAGAGDSYDHRGLIGRNNVSDVKLSLFYQRQGGDGPLRLQLTKLGRNFTAELSPGRARLLSADFDGGEPVELASAALPAGGSHPVHIEFMNVDYRVTLRVDGRDLLQTTPQQYRPDVESLLRGWRNKSQPKPEIRLGAEAQACTLSHVTLWRDVYYTNHDFESYSSDIKWGIPSRPVKLGPDEYWVLGDNSLMSGDGRYWGMPVDLPEEGLRAQPGVVPGRFLLGKAFFVYWPAGYRLSSGSPGVVPNFGNMRFIR